MRTTICGLVFLAFAALAQGQVTSPTEGQGREQAICKHMLTTSDDKYYRGNVRSFLDSASRGFSFSFGDQAIQSMGDGASIATLKFVHPSDLLKPEFVKAYLEMARTAFSQPERTICTEDKSPEVTLFLLDYLREKVQDKELQAQIDSTKEYVLKQVGPPKQSTIQVPPQPPK